jgi:hypothetical protein
VLISSIGKTFTKCPKVLTVLLLVGAAAVSARAQGIQEISFCPAGVQGDGFVDWSKLPAAPAPPYNGPELVTATVPVGGISGLAATITVQGMPYGPSSLYSALNPANLFVGLIGGTPVTVTFNKPVQGVSVVFRSYGRSSHGFHMSANDVYGNTTSVTPPPPAQVDAEGFEYPFDELSAAPLQIHSTSANLTSVAFGFDGDVAENGAFNLINFRVESGSAPDPATQVPLNGLKAWYRADRSGSAQLLPGISTVGNWPDQSGNGNDAVAADTSSVPGLSLDGSRCSPVVAFTGPQALRFNLSIAGWSGMTMITASQTYADGGSVVGWTGRVPNATTWLSPAQATVTYGFGTGQNSALRTYRRAATLGGDFTVTTIRRTWILDELFVDGVLGKRDPHRYAPLIGATGTIGKGFTGNIGEVLIYDRALTENERLRVEQYLRAKYGSR